MRSCYLHQQIFSELTGKPVGYIEVAEFSHFTQDDLLHDNTICEVVFAITQNLEDLWVDRVTSKPNKIACKVICRVKNARSTMIGDLLTIREDNGQERLYECKSLGWEKIR